MGPADVATFGLSNNLIVSISADTLVNAIVSTPDNSGYHITVNPGIVLTISGEGVLRGASLESGTDFFGNGGRFVFSNRTNAGDSQIRLEDSSATFADNSTAGHANIFQTYSFLTFSANASAGDAIVGLDTSFVLFKDSSTAGHASIGGGHPLT